MSEQEGGRRRRIVRVLVYEGPEDKVIGHLKRRGVKGHRDSGLVNGGYAITERFVNHDDVLMLLGELVTNLEMVQGMGEAHEINRAQAEMVLEIPTVNLPAPHTYVVFDGRKGWVVSADWACGIILSGWGGLKTRHVTIEEWKAKHAGIERASEEG